MDRLTQKTNTGFLIEYRGKRIKCVRKAFCKLLNRIGIKLPYGYNGVHVLRHTAATILLKKTNNISLVKEVLGHSKIEMTLSYAHVLDKDKKDALQKVWEKNI